MQMEARELSALNELVRSAHARFYGYVPALSQRLSNDKGASQVQNCFEVGDLLAVVGQPGPSTLTAIAI